MENHDKEVAPAMPLLNRRSVFRAGLEIISIVLAVLLALAVSEWQENRNKLERTEAALRQVQTELSQNLELLEFVHDRNVALIELLSQESTTVDQEAQFTPALQIADSAWKALGSTGLSGFVDFDLMVTLSQTYALIDIYRRSGYSLLDANLWVRATATATERDMKKIDDSNLCAMNCSSQFQLIVDVESALIDAHRKALAEPGLGKKD